MKRKSLEMRVFDTVSKEEKPAYSQVEEQLVWKEKQALLQTVVNRLPSQQRIILHLSKDKGLRRSEIAECLQLSPNTVKVHLHRAMQFMKEQLTCFTLLFLLFLCSNIFFSSSNTKHYLEELFNRAYLLVRSTPEKMPEGELLSDGNMMKDMAQAFTISLIKK